MDSLSHVTVFESFGLPVEVRTDDRELFDRLPQALPEWRPGNGSPASATFGVTRDGSVTLDGDCVARTNRSVPATLAVLATELRHYLALHAPEHIFVHAGVVSAAGVGIVIPGGSYSGKTTLVARLLDQGAEYYSDEYAVVDKDGLIHPYPRELYLRAERGWGNRHTPVSVARSGTEPLSAGVIVVAHYERGATWRPVCCTAAEGALALLEHTVPARSRPGRALAAARKVADGARVLSGVRGEADEVAKSLFGTFRFRNAEQSSDRGFGA